MKTLYLHVGTPKTATTSIQSFLNKNKDVLEKYGYCYPASLHRYPDVNPIRNGHFLVGNVIKEDGTRDTDQEKIYLEEGLKQVEDYFKKVDNVILSDESIWRALSYTRKTLLSDLRSIGEKNGFRIKVIVYLRRQDKFLLSRWNQSIKQNFAYSATYTCDEFFKSEKKKKNKIFNYGTKLDEISRDIGKENLIVRRFDKSKWKDDSIIRDFMNEIGLEPTDEFQELEINENLKLGKNATEIKRIINKNNNLDKKEIAYLGNSLRKISALDTNKKPSAMLTVEETRAFLSKYEKENERVAAEYCKDGEPLFSDEIKELPKWSPKNDEMFEDMIQFISTVVVQIHRENIELKNKIDEIDKESKIFQDKVRHPIRTMWGRFIRLIKR